MNSTASDARATLATGVADVGASVGEQARRGSVWMVAATGTTKGMGLVSQLALAWMMSREEFGVYAIAISLSVLFSLMRDGGLPTVLVQKARHFDLYAGTAFWMMLTINTATGLAIAAAARPAARFYHQPELYAVMTLFAITVPLYVPASLLSLRLTASMRFRELGIVQVVSALMRNLLLLLFVWLGFGAKSFILPLLVTNVTDALLLWYLTRYSPWTRPVRFRLWPKLMGSGRWVLLGTFAFALGNNGVYFLLGKILPSEIVGTYFFAFQLVMSLGILVANSSYQVLFAAFSRVRDDGVRLRTAVTRALSAIVLITSAASLAVAVVFRPLEHVLWHGKWAAAAGAVEVFAVLWPAVAFVSVLHAVQAAAGRFRLWGLIALITSTASICGCALGALLSRSAGIAALGYAAGTLLGLLINVRYALTPLGIHPVQAMFSALRPWLATMAAAAASVAVGRLFGNALLALLVSLLCFGIMAFIGLRLIANDSLQLVLDWLRRMISTRTLAHRSVVAGS